MKWTESKVKEKLYRKYCGNWLAEHGFNLVDIIKKYCEYSGESNINLITKEKFEDFEYNNNLTKDEMWLSYYDWESEVLCDELSGLIISALDEDYVYESYECLFTKDYKYAYFSGPYAKLKIQLEDNTEATSITEVAYDIAMALINFEYENEDEFPKIISDTSNQEVDKTIDNLFCNYKDYE